MKYFTKEVKIGLTGIIAIAALFLGLNFLKGINLFKPTNSYYIEFADIKGLAKSGPVYANGYKIGGTWWWKSTWTMACGCPKAPKPSW